MWRQTWRASAVTIATLFLLMLVAMIVITPPNDLRARRSGPRHYDDVKLETVILELERDGWIPNGSQWTEPGLKGRRLSAWWLFATDRQILEIVAARANVRVEFPAGYHGEIAGPIRVSPSERDDSGALVAGLRGPTRQDARLIQEAVVRESVAGWDPLYFVAHCLSVSPDTARHGASLSERMGLIAKGTQPDADATFLAQLSDLRNQFQPGSACAEETGDVVERSSGRGPSLISIVGPVEVIFPDHVLVLEFTTSGFLTETVTEFELRRIDAGRWSVVRQTILLQA